MPDTDGSMENGPVKHYAATEYCIFCRCIVIDASSVGMGCGKAMDCTAAASLLIASSTSRQQRTCNLPDLTERPEQSLSRRQKSRRILP
jgi:hypothetical protein